MHVDELPVGSSPPALECPHFPTREQALVWRNWGVIPASRLAFVLGTDEANVRMLAEGMGLPGDVDISEHWLSRGYATIIRKNWHLLPYQQLLQLLDRPVEWLDYALKEDDFLFHKLGGLKPAAEPVKYRPLTEAEARETERIRDLTARHFPDIRNQHDRQFRFVGEFRESSEPERRVPSAARVGEVVLDGRWSITGAEQSRRIRLFADKFIRSHRARWGVDWGGSDGPAVNIRLAAEAFAGKPVESHSIEISKNGIDICAAGEAGVLRALQHLTGMMEERGGPYLPPSSATRIPKLDLRLIYPYHILYGDSLSDPELQNIPEGLFSRYSEIGINGIWFQAVLYTLFPLERMPELSEGYRERLRALRSITERAADYGIGVYLYLNEPRAMRLPFFERYPSWRGAEHPKHGIASLCTGAEEVREYLRRSTAALFTEAPELAGVFTITQSENPTNCRSHAGWESCPRCRGRSVGEVLAETNKAIADGVHSVKSEARVIAWTWGWQKSCMEEAIRLLPPDVELMATSETEVPTNIGGVRGEVCDYSFVNIGPGELAKGQWAQAAARGLRTAAKVQLNNSWECSIVPYVPVLSAIDRHISGVLEEGVTGLMASWTLGGYPSPNMELIDRYCWAESGGASPLLSLAQRRYGVDAADDVVEAWGRFTRAFEEFPFHVSVLYVGPHNSGPMNLLYAEPTGYTATMVGFPYDDLEHWRASYPAEVFEEQLKKFCELWMEGLRALDRVESRNKEITEFSAVSRAVYIHMRSAYLQTRFVRTRQQLAEREDAALICEIVSVLEEEISLAKELAGIVSEYPTIGFEATNHYIYTLQDLREKVLNCEYLRELYAARGGGR